LAGRHEPAHLPNLDDHTAAIVGSHRAFEHGLGLHQLFGPLPILLGLRPADAQHQVAFTVLAHHIDRNLIADVERIEHLTNAIHLAAVDDPFGLVADVN